MVTISREWREHLTPKLTHPKLNEVQALLQRWFGSDYGKFWLHVATQEFGIVRVKPGDYIPAVHHVPGRPLFVAPQRAIRPGHRIVAPTDFASGRPLEDGEMALRPEIRLGVVEDETLLDAAMRGDFAPHTAGVRKPSHVFSAPAELLIRPEVLPAKAYVLYQHIFGEGPHRMTAFSMSVSLPAAGRRGGWSLVAQ